LAAPFFVAITEYDGFCGPVVKTTLGIRGYLWLTASTRIYPNRTCVHKFYMVSFMPARNAPSRMTRKPNSKEMVQSSASSNSRHRKLELDLLLIFKSLIFMNLLLVSSPSILVYRYSFFLFLICLLASHLTLFIDYRQ